MILLEGIWTYDLRDRAPKYGYYRMKPEGRCVTLHVQCSEPVTNGLLPSSKVVFAWTAGQQGNFPVPVHGYIQPCVFVICLPRLSWRRKDVSSS